MAKTPVASEIHKPLDVHRNISAEFAFNFMVGINNLADTVDFRLRQLIHFGIRIDIKF